MGVRVATGVLEIGEVGVASSGGTVGLAIAPAVDVTVGAPVAGAVDGAVEVTVGESGSEVSGSEVAGSGSGGSESGDPQIASKLTAGGSEDASPHIQPSTSPEDTWRNAAPMLA